MLSRSFHGFPISDLPSVVHAGGCVLTVPILVTEPSTKERTYRPLPSGESYLVKASRRPSGDHEGKRSLPALSVILWGAPPSRAAT